MANRRLISSAVAGSRLGFFADVIGERLDYVDLSPILVYMYDTVDASAFPFLARQLDVESYKGLDRCSTDAQRRTLLKSAIDLHRHIGTFDAITTAMSIISFVRNVDYIIEENVPLYHGGINVWCAFRVKINSASQAKLGKNTLDDLMRYIAYYKNERSILVSVYIGLEPLSDTIFESAENDRDTLILTETVVAGDFNDDFNNDYYN